jgi:hypothetical protein
MVLVDKHEPPTKQMVLVDKHEPPTKQMVLVDKHEPPTCFANAICIYLRILYGVKHD